MNRHVSGCERVCVFVHVLVCVPFSPLPLGPRGTVLTAWFVSFSFLQRLMLIYQYIPTSTLKENYTFKIVYFAKIGFQKNVSVYTHTHSFSSSYFLIHLYSLQMFCPVSAGGESALFLEHLSPTSSLWRS